ncbi:F-box-like domain-containing protein [Legionella drozanskii]|uniref:F-box-like domain-containing protein n=1 Tax=Legionella drozanskii TaxID=96228 RepID=UPI00104158A2|nr:F-box-like domain-containing protein [Legionella drozanskii]
MKEQTEFREPGKLPEEVWIAILSWLDPEELIDSVQLVSKLFYNLANDASIWKRLFLLFFPDEVPEPFPAVFDWKKEFNYLYVEHYGALKTELRKLIFPIIAGNTEKVCKSLVSIEDLQAADFILIRTAVQFKQQAILAHFHSLVRQQLQLEEEHLPLGWAVLFNQKEVVHSILAAQPHLINYNALQGLTKQPKKRDKKTITVLAAEAGHLELLEEFLKHPGNPEINNKLLNIYHSIIRSRQISVFKWFTDFISHNEEIFPHVVKIDTGFLACKYNASTIFKASINPLHQEMIYWEKELKRLTPEPNLSSKKKVDFVAIQQRTKVLVPQLPELDPLKKEFDEIELPMLHERQEAILKLAKKTDDDELKKLIAPWAYDLQRDKLESLMKASMYSASTNGQINVIRYALDNKLFDINDPLSDRGDTLLYQATVSNKDKLVQFLLAYGANPESALALLIALRESPSEPEDHSELIDLFLATLKERKQTLSSFRLMETVVTHNKIDLLEFLLTVDPHSIHLVNQYNHTPLCSAIVAKSNECVRFLLASGAEINLEVLNAAISVNDSKLVQDLLERAGANASELVNALYCKLIESSISRKLVPEPIIKSLKNPEMQKLLLPYLNREKTICNMLEQTPDLIALRNALDCNDLLLRFPPIAKEKVLAFVQTLRPKQNLMATELQIEIELEKKLRETAIHGDDLELTIATLKIQIKAMGLRRGQNARWKKTDSEDFSMAVSLKLPSDLAKLNAYLRLASLWKGQSNKISQLKNQLKELYSQAYLEGKKEQFEARSSSKRKPESKQPGEKTAKRSRLTEAEEVRVETSEAEQLSDNRKGNSTDENEPPQDRGLFASESNISSLNRLGMFGNRNLAVETNRSTASTSTTSRSEAAAEEGQAVYSPSFFVVSEHNSQPNEDMDFTLEEDSQSKIFYNSNSFIG